MYHRNINIAIIGEPGTIKPALESNAGDGHTEFPLFFAPSLDEDLAARADVIIFTGLSEFGEARAAAKPGAYLVACLSADEEANLSRENRESLDDVWITPLSDYCVRLRVSHLLDEIGARDWSTFLLGCLDTFINSLEDMVWFKDLDGIHRKVNDYFCDFVGKSREEIEGCSHSEVWGVPESEELTCKESDQAAMDAGVTVSAEEVVQTDTGKRLFKTLKTPVRGLEGEILGTVGIAQDLTSMLNLNMELDIFLEMMPLPLMICDVDDHITKANAKFLEFFETGMGDLLERAWTDWYEANILHEISPLGEDIYRRFVRADGRVSFLKIISHEMNDSFGNYLGVIHVFEDVTEDKELEYNIWKLANTDALTEIANRQAFYEYAKRIKRNANVSLFYVDLDNFKQVNDIYGHKAGDEALKATSAILREVFGKDFPARLGGDEFVACVRRDVSLEEIKETAQNLIDLMKERFAGDERLNGITCSVGVLYNGSMKDGIEPLIKLTDAAMYEAKKQGKSCYRIAVNSDTAEIA